MIMADADLASLKGVHGQKQHFPGYRALHLNGPASSVPFAGDDRATPATFRFPKRRCHAANGVARHCSTARLYGAGPDGDARAYAAPCRPAHGAGRDPRRWPGNTGRSLACRRAGEPFPSDSSSAPAARSGQPGRDCPTSVDRSGNDGIATCERHDAGDPSSGRAGRRPTCRAEIAVPRGVTT